MPRSPHHADVFSHLPVQLMAELDTPEVAELLERLVAAGWDPAQLRHRMGPSLIEQPGAARLVARLGALVGALAPGPVRDEDGHARSACSLCAGEGAFSVTDTVALCRRCVRVLASGRSGLSETARRDTARRDTARRDPA